MSERIRFDSEEDNNLSIEDLAKLKPNREKPKKSDVDSVSEISGFSRRAAKKNKKKSRSPYTQLTSIKLRPKVKELFEEISEELEYHKQVTFEEALLALCDKEGLDDLKKQLLEEIG